MKRWRIVMSGWETRWFDDPKLGPIIVRTFLQSAQEFVTQREGAFGLYNTTSVIRQSNNDCLVGSWAFSEIALWGYMYLLYYIDVNIETFVRLFACDMLFILNGKIKCKIKQPNKQRTKTTTPTKIAIDWAMQCAEQLSEPEIRTTIVQSIAYIPLHKHTQTHEVIPEYLKHIPRILANLLRWDYSYFRIQRVKTANSVCFAKH